MFLCFVFRENGGEWLTNLLIQFNDEMRHNIRCPIPSHTTYIFSFFLFWCHFSIGTSPVCEISTLASETHRKQIHKLRRNDSRCHICSSIHYENHRLPITNSKNGHQACTFAKRQSRKATISNKNQFYSFGSSTTCRKTPNSLSIKFVNAFLWLFLQWYEIHHWQMRE